jgi:hypothetical protein
MPFQRHTSNRLFLVLSTFLARREAQECLSVASAGFAVQITTTFNPFGTVNIGGTVN